MPISTDTGLPGSGGNDQRQQRREHQRQPSHPVVPCQRGRRLRITRRPAVDHRRGHVIDRLGHPRMVPGNRTRSRTPAPCRGLPRSRDHPPPTRPSRPATATGGVPGRATDHPWQSRRIRRSSAIRNGMLADTVGADFGHVSDRALTRDHRRWQPPYNRGAPVPTRGATTLWVVRDPGIGGAGPVRIRGGVRCSGGCG